MHPRPETNRAGTFTPLPARGNRGCGLAFCVLMRLSRTLCQAHSAVRTQGKPEAVDFFRPRHIMKGMEKQKQTIYLETSAVSAYFDFKKQDPLRKAVTREFWSSVLPSYEAHIGTITILELADTAPEHKKEIFPLLEHITELRITEEIEKLADAYLSASLFPQAKRPDALHVAIASVNQIDFLVSWNQQHITRPHRAKLIQDFNASRNLFIPEITTPEELLISHQEECT